MSFIIRGYRSDEAVLAGEHGCFDFGKSPDLEECARCRVLLALHDAGQGDLRKIRIPLPRPENWALAICFLLAADRSMQAPLRRMGASSTRSTPST